MRDRAGSTSLEVAICLPVLLALVFGIIEFGRMLVLEHSMTWATTVTMRYAVVHGSTSQAPTSAADLQARWTAVMPPVLFGVTCTTVATMPASAPGSIVTITASCPWSPVVSITGLTGTTLTSSLSAMIQY